MSLLRNQKNRYAVCKSITDPYLRREKVNELRLLEERILWRKYWLDQFREVIKEGREIGSHHPSGTTKKWREDCLKEHQDLMSQYANTIKQLTDKNYQ